MENRINYSAAAFRTLRLSLVLLCSFFIAQPCQTYRNPEKTSDSFQKIDAVAKVFIHSADLSVHKAPSSKGYSPGIFSNDFAVQGSAPLFLFTCFIISFRNLHKFARFSTSTFF